MGTIRSLYKLFLKKREECADEKIQSCIDTILVITGDYFHQKYCLLLFQQTCD